MMNFSRGTLSFLLYKYIYRYEMKLDVLFSDIFFYIKKLFVWKKGSVNLQLVDCKSPLQTKLSCVLTLNAICNLMNAKIYTEKGREKERAQNST